MAEVDPNQVKAQATLLPAAATDENGLMPTQGATVNQTLQTPATPAPQQQLQLQPSAQPITATSPNKHLMSLGARILGALAGEERSYSYDDNGKLVAAAQPLTTTQKIGRIIGKATTALAAPTPEGRTSLAANVGAGANAVKQQSQGQDVLKRAQAKEDYEQQQQAKVRKYEIARQNALTLSTYYGAKKAANDMDPHFAQNESLLNAVKASPELGAHATEMSDTQLEQEVSKDPAFAHTHIIKPLGWAPETDENGQQVMVDGQPKFYMRMAVIDGTKDGKVKITPEMANDFKTYGPMARIPNAGDLKAGDEYDLAQLLPAMNKVDEQRKVVQQGWEHSELGWVKDPKDPKKEIPVETNKMMPPDMAGRTRPLTVKPMALEAEEGKTALEKAQAGEALGKEKEALANAAVLMAGMPQPGPEQDAAVKNLYQAYQQLPRNAQTILRGLNPADQSALLQLWSGRTNPNDWTKMLRKGVNQLSLQKATGLIGMFDPTWRENKYEEVKKTEEKYLDPNTKLGGGLLANGQLLRHAADAKEVSEILSRTSAPVLNMPINEARKYLGLQGAPLLSRLEVAMTGATNEWENVIKSGHAATADENKQRAILASPDSNVGQIAATLYQMGSQSLDRLGELDQPYITLTGGHYPGLLDSKAREAAAKLGFADRLKDYGAPGQLFTGPSPMTQNPLDKSSSQPKPYAPNVDPKNIHTDGKVTIGWDPTQKTWVDAFTGKVYNQTPPAGAQ